MERLAAEYDFGQGSVDLVFVDHDKSAYLPDLRRIEAQGWLHTGSIVVADNVKFPGAPEYHAYLQEQEGKAWRTTEHDTHLEYQSLMKDLVLESEYLA
jgi:catechol O-methyltransferase